MWDVLLHKWLRIPYALHVHVDKKVRRPRATVLFLHGIGNSGESWQRVIQDLPSDIRVVVIDLLGFGKSPRPGWAIYNAKTQARSVIATFLKLNIRQPVIIVGHSLGGLVAVEVAHRYPLIVRSLVLCSPPFYKASQQKKLLPSYDTLLKELYGLVQRYPEKFLLISQLAMRLGLVDKSYNVTSETVPVYINALTASIINQTTLNDALKLTVPTRILYGQFDPMVVFANFKWLAKHNPHVTIKSLLVGHEMLGLYIPAIRKEIENASQK